jgi:hypothetical protein
MCHSFARKYTPMWKLTYTTSDGPALLEIPNFGLEEAEGAAEKAEAHLETLGERASLSNISFAWYEIEAQTREQAVKQLYELHTPAPEWSAEGGE